MLDIVLALAVLFLGIAVLLTGRKVINVMTTNTQALEELRAEIEQNESATEAVLTLVNGLNNRLTEALAGDESNLVDSITALRDELDANNVKLATAVTENTAAAEDSDSFHDPAPIGEEPADPSSGVSDAGSADTDSETASDSTSSETTGESEATDTEQPVDEQPVTEEQPAEEAVGEGDESLPTGDDVVEANEGTTDSEESNTANQ